MAGAIVVPAIAFEVMKPSSGGDLWGGRRGWFGKAGEQRVDLPLQQRHQPFRVDLQIVVLKAVRAAVGLHQGAGGAGRSAQAQQQRCRGEAPNRGAVSGHGAQDSGAPALVYLAGALQAGQDRSVHPAGRRTRVFSYNSEALLPAVGHPP